MAAAPTNSQAVFAALRPVLAKYARKLTVTADGPEHYALDSTRPSPFPQHKGKPLFFASVKIGKAYVSFHLMPIYMCPPLGAAISPALKKRMQGKACFNFKAVPEPELVDDLRSLTAAAFERWKAEGYT